MLLCLRIRELSLQSRHPFSCTITHERATRLDLSAKSIPGQDVYKRPPLNRVSLFLNERATELVTILAALAPPILATGIGVFARARCFEIRNEQMNGCFDIGNAGDLVDGVGVAGRDR